MPRPIGRALVWRRGSPTWRFCKWCATPLATRPAPIPPAELAVPCRVRNPCLPLPFVRTPGPSGPLPARRRRKSWTRSERRSTPFWDVAVLARDLQADFSRRLTVRSGEDGTLAEPDRQRLLDALWETLGSDGYLYAMLRVDGESAGSLWTDHSNGFLIPLTSEHAVAGFGRDPSLMPESLGDRWAGGRTTGRRSRPDPRRQSNRRPAPSTPRMPRTAPRAGGMAERPRQWDSGGQWHDRPGQLTPLGGFRRQYKKLSRARGRWHRSCSRRPSAPVPPLVPRPVASRWSTSP